MFRGGGRGEGGRKVKRALESINAKDGNEVGRGEGKQS